LKWVYASLAALSVAIAAAVIGVVEFSGDSSSARSTVKHTPPQRVSVVIPGTNDAKENVVDGGIVGEGTFRATGAITDSGWARAYRAMPNPDLIVFRYVTKGKKGAITYHVAIHIKRLPPVSQWTIESGTGAYKGLQGSGNESENSTYTVTYLKGSVWR
jgi:hypothetical protein